MKSAKRQPSLQKTFFHLTTDRFSLESGVYVFTKIIFSLFVAYFFSIWATYFCWIYKLFVYLSTYQLGTFLSFEPKILKNKVLLSSSRRNSIIYKVNEQVFPSTIRCLLFCNLTIMFFQNSQIICISLYLLVGNFFDKN